MNLALLQPFPALLLVVMVLIHVQSVREGREYEVQCAGHNQTCEQPHQHIPGPPKHLVTELYNRIVVKETHYTRSCIACNKGRGYYYRK